MFVSWCNGSTTVFGTVCLGSNPGETTILKALKYQMVLKRFLIYMTMETQIIQNRIYEIRGVKVMLDSDLADLYQVETKKLNQSVRRNINRFPSDFMFQLTQDEYNILKSQIVTSSWGGRRTLPYAFTEQGLAMLSGILNSDVAIDVNISIMRAFVAIRKAIAHPPVNDIAQLQREIRELKQYMEEVFTDYNDINEDTRMQIELINETLAEFQADRKHSRLPRKIITGFNPEK